MTLFFLQLLMRITLPIRDRLEIFITLYQWFWVVQYIPALTLILILVLTACLQTTRVWANKFLSQSRSFEAHLWPSSLDTNNIEKFSLTLETLLGVREHTICLMAQKFPKDSDREHLFWSIMNIPWIRLVQLLVWKLLLICVVSTRKSDRALSWLLYSLLFSLLFYGLADDQNRLVWSRHIFYIFFWWQFW